MILHNSLYKRCYVKTIQTSLTIAIIITLTGCTQIIKGYRFKDETMAKVKVGETDKISLIRTLGMATFEDSLNDEEVVVYCSSVTYDVLFIKGYETQRKIVAYYFKNKLLNRIETLSLSDGKRIESRSIKVIFPKPNPIWTLPFYTIL